MSKTKNFSFTSNLSVPKLKAAAIDSFIISSKFKFAISIVFFNEFRSSSPKQSGIEQITFFTFLFN